MNILRIVFCLVSACCVISSQAFAFPQGSAPHGNPESPPPPKIEVPQHVGAETIVVAKVNGVDIKMPELMNRIQDITMQKYGREEITPQLAMKIKKEAIDRLITEELAYQRAKSLGIEIKPEVIQKRIDQFKKKAGSDEKFTEILAQKNMTEMGLWVQLERYYAVKEAIDLEVTQKIVLSPEEIEKTYEENKAAFVQEEKISITDVVFFLNPKEEASLVTAKEIYQKIVKDFGGNPEKLEQGPYVVRENIEVVEMLEPNLYAEAKKLQLNNISEPLVIDGTLHIIKLTKYRPRQEKTKAEVLEVLEQKLKESMQEQALTAWRDSLKKDASIEVVEMAVE